MSKHDLRARSVFHHTRDATWAHLTVVMASLAVARYLQDAPALRDAVIEAFRFDRRDVARIATPELLDDLVRTSLGLRLQRARIAKGLSQEALAHAAGISTYTYQKFEKGESRPGTPMNPRLRTLIALAAALDVRVEELVGGMSE